MMITRRRIQHRLGRFRDEEDGSMIVFTLFLLVVMLVVSGMAVDFMRFEAKRSAMQGCIDNAVLAAADMDKAGTEEELKAVAEDWFGAGDCIGVLDGRPEVKPEAVSRTVSASADLEIDTFFLRLIGMDTLTAGAVSAANEGVGDIEVSLVLDISGSMRDSILDEDGDEVDFDEDTDGTQSRSKMTALQMAATSFVDTLLADEYQDKISISLVPYSGHVNIGPDLFNAINTNKTHDYSYCVDFPEAELSKVAFNDSVTHEQVPHFQYNSAYVSGTWTPLIDQPNCPRNSFEQVIPLSQDETELNLAINSFEPRSATAIYMGLKWGIALLDPSMGSTLDNLTTTNIDAVFEERPANYAINTGTGSSIKYLVLMTDGQNDPPSRILPEFADDPSEIAYWDTNHWWSFRRNLCGWNAACYHTNDYMFTEDVATLNTNMQTLCQNARDAGIIIYGIAMGATTDGKQQLSDCVDSPSRYHETTGATLGEIFDAIAGQITDLRLTQ